MLKLYEAMPRIAKIDTKIIYSYQLYHHWTKCIISISNTCSKRKNYKTQIASRKNIHFINNNLLYFIHSLSLSLPLPCITDTIVKLTLLFEGWSRAWSPRMAGTWNTWKLMVCSLPSCCFVAMQRRHGRL